MFKKEISFECKNLIVAWYPKEKLCLVIKEKSKRIYSKIPIKYLEILKYNGVYK